jgi:branched-chain amino acid transport system substrate-binding protein
MRGTSNITYLRWERILIVCIISVVFLGLGGCQTKQPIKIGFVGSLTGRLSDLGTAGRNGIMLAVEQINQAGGIKGRPVELLVKDDQNTADVALQVDQELINAGVVAIIGHMTSAMSVAAVSLMNQHKMLLLSPTTSTDLLTGIDDYFFRVCPGNKTQTDQLADYMFHKKQLRKIAAIYDLSNQAFSETMSANFTATFEQMGGSVVSTTTFTSGEDISYLDLAQIPLNANPDGLFIIAGALDTAMLCQQVRKLNPEIPIISSAWAFTPDLIQHGGAAVEGVIVSESFYQESQQKSYVQFQTLFRERFGKEPEFAGTFSHEATQVLFTALAKNSDPQQLKATLLKTPVFPGLQGDISFDPYGDTQRKRLLIVVKNGQFVTVE